MSQNSGLLKIIGVLEAVRTAKITGQGIPYDREEVYLLCLQATLEMLCGGSPTIILPAIVGTGGANDPVIARNCTGIVTPSPFVPSGSNYTTQAAVAADGGTTPITFAAPFATVCNQVLFSVRDYTGSDNAALTARASGLSTSGFSVTVGGGQSGTTCTVDYFPVGT